MIRLWHKLIMPVVALNVTVSLGACDYKPEEPQTTISKPPEIEPIITKEGFKVYDGAQPPYYGADPNRPVVLINNENASNPTWHELKRFLATDTTDENSYLPGIKVCAEFAAELHNNAEKAGIKAAWVALEFEDDSKGHALNAFETTDHGLIFIDSTGGIPVIKIPAVNEETREIIEESECFETNDKKAYVEIGRQLGFVGLDVPSSSFGYKAYLDYIYQWDRLKARLETYVDAANKYEGRIEAFEQSLAEYESILGGRTVIEDEEEYDKLRSMYEKLKQMSSELEQEGVELNTEAYRINAEAKNLGRCRREALGTVRSVKIYW